MRKLEYKTLLDAGLHFGHLKRKWNPNMSPYIFMERNGIHIIDLNKTAAKMEEAAQAIKQIAKSGKKILFVATKKQAKELVAEHVKSVNMPYVTERWPGGMLTNFATIRKAVRKMASIDKMSKDGTFDKLSKKERLQISRERAKLEKQLGSIADLNRLPAALFVVDISKEYIAVREAKKLNIPTFAIVDTNSDPTTVDFAIPANDDASKSIDVIIKYMVDAIQEGLEERKMDKEKQKEEKKEEEAAQELIDKSKSEVLKQYEEEEDEKANAAKKARARKKKDEAEKEKEEMNASKKAAPKKNISRKTKGTK